MTEIERAAERLRRVDSGEHLNTVYGGSTPEEIEVAPFCVSYALNSERIDELAVIAAYLRETDPTPITEEFARRMFDDVRWQFEHAPYCLICTLGNLTLHMWPNKNESRLLGLNCPLIDNPTIGQFYKACDLFGVKLKGE